MIDTHVLKDYTVIRSIGEGGFSQVFLGTHKATNTTVAIKVISKVFKDNDIHNQYLATEHEIIQKLRHPFICGFYEYLESNDQICIVLEYVQNGTLLDKLNRFGPLAEKDAAMIFAQLMLVLHHLHHDLSIAHRDLKLENILFDDCNNIRLIDFGFSKMLMEGSSFMTRCGSLLYCAPELIAGHEYSTAVDIWSAGIILFVLCSGYFPFDDKNVTVLSQKIIYSELDIPQRFSDNLEDLVCRMLTKNPAERITLEEILNHPWLTDAVKRYKGILDSITVGKEEIQTHLDAFKFNINKAPVLYNLIERKLTTEKLYRHFRDQVNLMVPRSSLPVIKKGSRIYPNPQIRNNTLPSRRISPKHIIRNKMVPGCSPLIKLIL